MLSTEAVATLRCNSLSHSSVVLEIFHKQRHQGDLVLFSSFVAHTLSPLWESLEIITKIKIIYYSEDFFCLYIDTFKIGRINLLLFLKQCFIYLKILICVWH